MHPICHRFAAPIAVAALVFSHLAALITRADFQGATHMTAYEEAPILYSKGTPKSAIARLQAELDSQRTKLVFDEHYGFLLSILEELNVPKSSQMLVFSKTSLQRDRISPGTPRAIFFNDEVYVGFIPGAPMIEISVADPEL